MQQRGELEGELDALGRAHDRVAPPIGIADPDAVERYPRGAAPIDVDIAGDLDVAAGRRSGPPRQRRSKMIRGEIDEEPAGRDQQQNRKGADDDARPFQ